MASSIPDLGSAMALHEDVEALLNVTAQLLREPQIHLTASNRSTDRLENKPLKTSTTVLPPAVKRMAGQGQMQSFASQVPTAPTDPIVALTFPAVTGTTSVIGASEKVDGAEQATEANIPLSALILEGEQQIRMMQMQAAGRKLGDTLAALHMCVSSWPEREQEARDRFRVSLESYMEPVFSSMPHLTASTDSMA